jgi:hypothetical protein
MGIGVDPWVSPNWVLFARVPSIGPVPGTAARCPPPDPLNGSRGTAGGEPGQGLGADGTCILAAAGGASPSPEPDRQRWGPGQGDPLAAETGVRFPMGTSGPYCLLIGKKSKIVIIKLNT